jgi:hypothetical protein
MTLWVHAFCGYPSYSGTGAGWKPDDYDALTVVRAVKGQDLKKGYAKIKSLTGAVVTVDAARRGNAKALFGAWAAARLVKLGVQAGWLIPIPSSDCLALDTDRKGMELARAVEVRAAGMKAESALCWTEQLTKAAEGGPRDVATLFPNLRIWTQFPEGPVVLVDDVVTSGGHALACAKLLREYGHEVEHVLCVAHTVHERPAKGMFSIAPYDLEAPVNWDL